MIPQIYVDTNSGENVLFETLCELSNNVTRKRLDLGDVCAELTDYRLVFERKTWPDLSSSICDGRWKEQKSRMLLCEEDNVPTRYMYIIEGPIMSWNSESYGLHGKCLWGAIVKTSLRDEIPVFHSNSSVDTAHIINYIIDQYDTTKSPPKNPTCVIGSTTFKRKRDNMESSENLYKAMLSIIPGMSMTKADAIHKKWPTLKELMSVTKKELEAVECGNKKLGPKLATKITLLIS